MLNIKTIMTASLLSAAALVSSNVLAWGSYTNYSDGGYDSYDGSTSKTSVTMTGWSNTGTDGHLKSGGLSYSSTYGYKVGNDRESTDYDSKYIDNSKHTDSVLFDYGDKCVVLNEVYVSKHGNDADMAILAYLGSKKGDDFKTYMSGKKYDDLIASNEWKVFSVDDVQDGSSYSTYGKKKGFNESEKVAASQWLVMAKNGESDDYFKIGHMGGYDHDGGDCTKVVKCTPPPVNVPEPQSLALLGLGLLGLVAARRRKA